MSSQPEAEAASGEEDRPPVQTDARVAQRAMSGRWLVAALLVTAVCAGLLAAQFAGLLQYPFHDDAVEPVVVADPERSLVVAVARTPGGPGEWANWAQVIKYLSDEIGQPVTVRYLSKEDEAAQVITDEHVDLAFVCAHHYVDLTETGACVGLVTPIIDGSTTTNSMIVVRPDDPAETIDDLKGSVFAVSDKSSLGGYSYVSYLTKRAGEVPEEYFGQLVVGETQEQNMEDVLAGEVRGTVVSSVQVVSWDMSRFKAIEISEPLGLPPVVVSTDMDRALQKRISDALVAMDGSTVLPATSAIDGFAALDPDDYRFAIELRGACGHHDHP